MKALFITLMLFSGQVINAQNIEADSLRKLLPTLKETPQMVLVLEGLSYAYVSTSPDTALKFALEGLRLAQKINDPKGKAYCTNALGNVYFSVGDYPQSLEMYLQALKLKEQLPKSEQAFGVTYFNIANVYTEQEDYPHALTYLYKTIQEDKKSKDSSGILFDLYSLSSIYLRMKKADSALHYGQQAFEMARRQKDENLVAAIVNNFGEIYFFLNNFSNAAVYYRQSITYAEAIKDNEVLASDYFGLAKVSRQNKLYDSSIYFASKALNIAQEAPFQKQVLDATSFLADVFKNTNHFDSAFYYLKLSIAAKDSLFNVEKIKKVQNLKLLVQQREQSMEASRLAYRNKVRLYIVLAATIVFLILAFILWRNNLQKQQALKLLQEQRDETDRQKAKVELAYQELRETQAQLIQKEKMASLGELTAGIAHEIQNPLNFIQNFSEVSIELAQELKTEASVFNNKSITELANDIYNNLKKVVNHGKRADAIVKSMLQHSSSYTGEKELTDINSLVEEYLNLAYYGIRTKYHHFKTNIEKHLDPLAGTANIITQGIGRVLLNVLNNAFYAVMQKSGQINGNYIPNVQVSTKRIDDMIEIRIKDNGNGIPQKHIDKIFQPFFTTKPTGEGTGLGLSLSYDIITLGHGGSLVVDSKEGEFTEFTIQLPA